MLLIIFMAFTLVITSVPSLTWADGEAAEGSVNAGEDVGIVGEGDNAQADPETQEEPKFPENVDTHTPGAQDPQDSDDPESSEDSQVPDPDHIDTEKDGVDNLDNPDSQTNNVSENAEGPNKQSDDDQSSSLEGLVTDELEISEEPEFQALGEPAQKIFTVTKHPVNDASAEEPVGNYDTFYDAIGNCKQEDLGYQYIVTMNADYTIPADEASWGKSKVNIILRSQEGHRYTLKKTNTRVLLTLYNQCALQVENVILDGSNAGEAFFVPEGTLTLGQGSVLQNFNDYEDADGPAIYVTGTGTVNILDGALIQNNKSDHKSSGVIQLNDKASTLNIYGGDFTNNQSAYFGGVVLSWGTINISGGNFSQNFAKASGGVIASYGGKVNITGGVFESNKAVENGGAIIFKSGDPDGLSISKTPFSNNSAERRGGAIYVKSDNVSLSDSSFSNNSAKTQGGAIYVESGNVSLSDSSFKQNESELGGGALFVKANTDIFNIKGCQFDGNATAFGGGIYMMDKTKLHVDSSEFMNNEAAYGAGIATAATQNIDATNSSLTISNSTFKNNVAWSGAGVFTTFPTTITSTGFTANQAILAKGDDERNPHDSGTGGALYIMNNETTISGTSFEENWAYGSGGAISINGYLRDDNKEVIGVKPAIKVTITGSSSFKNNSVSVGQGGAIYVAPYKYDGADYPAIGADQAYQALTTDGTTLFLGNKSGEGLFTPPADYDKYTNLAFDPVSDVTHGMLTRKSLLNNYDVNYKSPGVAIVFDTNGGTFADGEKVKSYTLPLGKVITIIEAPTREGYSFDYWKGSEYQPGDQYTVTKAHTFVAQWKPNETPSEIPEIVVPWPINVSSPTSAATEIKPIETGRPATPANLQEQVQQLPATGAADSLALSLFLSALGLSILASLRKQG
ncbi:MAG: InlB B-repeat-containing protein [Clostridiales bacterium]|nr:InlB B-repeat-containing protein [Clostridiales bacterium]